MQILRELQKERPQSDSAVGGDVQFSVAFWRMWSNGFKFSDEVWWCFSIFWSFLIKKENQGTWKQS